MSNEIIPSPHIGELLRAHVKKNRIYQNAWARKAHLNRKTIANYLKQPSMRVDTLFAVCQSLNYNFIEQIAALLPPDMPPHTDNPLQTRIAELERQVQDLKLHVEVLREALELVGRK